MSHARLLRRASTGSAVLALVAAGLLGANAGPALGGAAPSTMVGGHPERVEQPSASSPAPAKTATASCAGSRQVYSAGAEISYDTAGGTRPGGVAITSVVPNAAATFVTVTAHAMPWQTGTWSVTAYALCDLSTDRVVPVVGTGVATAQAVCPHGRVFGAGFRVGAPPTAAHVTELDLEDTLAGVAVTVDGPQAAQAEVAAIALCHRRGPSMGLTRAVSRGTGWPKVVSVQESHQGALYAVGVALDSPEPVGLDAIVPAEDDGTAWARGALLSPPQRAASARAAKGGSGPDGSVTVEAAEIGTFH